MHLILISATKKPKEPIEAMKMKSRNSKTLFSILYILE